MKNYKDDGNISEEEEEEEEEEVKSSDKKNEELPIELQKKKKTRSTKPFTIEDLKSSYGLEYIYHQFPPAFQRDTNNEGCDLNRLISMYTEWAFRLHPGLAFPDILSQTDSFGSKGSLRNFLVNLRDQERSNYLVCCILFISYYIILYHNIF
jgi:hypothetical protein